MNLILIVFVVFFSGFCSTSEENWEKIENLGNDLKDIDTGDSIKTVQSILNFGNLIPEVAPFTSLISGILGLFDDKDDGSDIDDQLSKIDDKLNKLGEGMEEIKRQLLEERARLIEIKQKLDQLENHLTKIDTNLFKISYGIDDLSNKIEDTMIKQSYKTHVENIDELMHSFQRFKTDMEDRSLRKDFVTQCDQQYTVKFADYIHDELKYQKILPLDLMISRNNDIKALSDWSKLFATDLSKSLILMGICMGVKKSIKSPEMQVNVNNTEVPVTFDALEV